MHNSTDPPYKGFSKSCKLRLPPLRAKARKGGSGPAATPAPTPPQPVNGLFRIWNDLVERSDSSMDRFVVDEVGELVEIKDLSEDERDKLAEGLIEILHDLGISLNSDKEPYNPRNLNKPSQAIKLLNGFNELYKESYSAEDSFLDLLVKFINDLFDEFVGVAEPGVNAEAQAEASGISKEDLAKAANSVLSKSRKESDFFQEGPKTEDKGTGEVVEGVVLDINKINFDYEGAAASVNLDVKTDGQTVPVEPPRPTVKAKNPALSEALSKIMASKREGIYTPKERSVEFREPPMDEASFKSITANLRQYSVYFRDKQLLGSWLIFPRLRQALGKVIDAAVAATVKKFNQREYLMGGAKTAEAKTKLMSSIKRSLEALFFITSYAPIFETTTKVAGEQVTTEVLELQKDYFTRSLGEAMTSMRLETDVVISFESPTVMQIIRGIESAPMTYPDFINSKVNQNLLFYSTVLQRMITKEPLYKVISDFVSLHFITKTGEDIEVLPFDVKVDSERERLTILFKEYSNAIRDLSLENSLYKRSEGRYAGLTKAQAEELFAKTIFDMEARKRSLWRDNPELRLGLSINEDKASAAGKQVLVADLERIKEDGGYNQKGAPRIDRQKLIQKSSRFREYRTYALNAYNKMLENFTAESKIKGITGGELKTKILQFKNEFDEKEVAKFWIPRSSK